MHNLFRRPAILEETGHPEGIRWPYSTTYFVAGHHTPERILSLKSTLENRNTTTS